jgi:hypothetical protein
VDCFDLHAHARTVPDLPRWQAAEGRAAAGGATARIHCGVSHVVAGGLVCQ